MKNLTKFLKLFLGIGIIVVILSTVCTKIVNQSELVVVSRFGKVINVIEQPGLYFKFPYPIDKFITFTSRVQVYDTQKTELLTKDQKNIILLTFVAWQIEDALKFYTTVRGDVNTFLTKLDSLVNNTKNVVLGNYMFTELFIAERENNKLGQLEENIYSLVKEKAMALYGVQIKYIGIKRLSVPEENIASVFRQMQADRSIVVSKYIEEGRVEAEKIRTQAKLKGSEIVTEANKEAAILKGNAEAETSRIYAQAYEKSPEFYEMIRSLESLKKITTNKTSIILRTDSPPFQLLQSKPKILPQP
ncbi:protease modulator HflC [Deltaproteobacteria bacterium TL4]